MAFIRFNRTSRSCPTLLSALRWWLSSHATSNFCDTITFFQLSAQFRVLALDVRYLSWLSVPISPQCDIAFTTFAYTKIILHSKHNVQYSLHQLKMFKVLLTLLLLAPIVLSSQLTYRSELAPRQGTCPAGKVICGDGCIPTGTACCGSYYCDSGTSCLPDGSCTCLSTETKCGTGCMPASASCCPLDLKYCPSGEFCAPVKGYCCNNVRPCFRPAEIEGTDWKSGRESCNLCYPPRL
jgi:hypothetical protein